MIGKLLKMQLLDEDDELAYSASGSAAPEETQQKEKDGRPTWMRQLHASLTTWLQLVPKVRAALRMMSSHRTVWQTDPFHAKLQAQTLCIQQRKLLAAVSEKHCNS